MNSMKNYIAFILGVVLFFSLNSCTSDEPLIITPDVSIVEVGKIITLTTNIQGNATWTSSDESVATVQDGLVTGINDGHAIITAQIGKSKGTANIYVIQEGGTYQGEYKLIWSEEFDGTTLDASRWNVETGGGGWGNQEKQYYTDRSENLRVQNGCLEIEARKETYYNNEYTSARINTKNKFDVAYGKIEARINFPKGRGTWGAFWMLGYGSWPTCGEIDIVEHVGNNPTYASHAIHTREKNGSKGNNWHSGQTVDNLEGGYHVYGVEWLQTYWMGVDALKFYVDGVYAGSAYASINSTFEDWPFTADRPEYIILNMAIGGTMGGSINEDMFNNPVIMYVDWVHVYQKQF